MKTKVSIAVVAIFVVTAVVARTQAQGPPFNPFPLILEKLDTIIGLLTPTSPEAGPVTLYTGFLNPGPTDAVYCEFANIGAQNIAGQVTLRRKSTTGATLGSTIDFDGVLAGQGIAGGGQILTEPQSFRCEISFVGFANNVRATAIVRAADSSVVAVLDAR
jgi:hypothetical protein